jgi:predicted dithiol-disulfide oxidoreductase (DUF899 family)
VSLASQALASPRRSADFGVDEWHGTNAFFRDGDGSSARYFVTSAATRGWAAPGATSTSPALGGQVDWEDSPEGYPQTAPYGWWNYHDAYGDAT